MKLKAPEAVGRGRTMDPVSLWAQQHPMSMGEGRLPSPEKRVVSREAVLLTKPVVTGFSLVRGSALSEERKQTV